MWIGVTVRIRYLYNQINVYVTHIELNLGSGWKYPDQLLPLDANLTRPCLSSDLVCYREIFSYGEKWIKHNV